MSMDKVKLEVQLAAINKATGPLKAIQTGSNETAKALKAAREQLKALNDQQKRVDGFRAASRDIAIHRQELAKAEETVKKISEAMKASAFPTKSMQSAFKSANETVVNLKGNITKLSEKLDRLGPELTAVGADTHKLAEFENQLKYRTLDATQAIERKSRALDVMNKHQNSLRGARYAYDKGIEQRNKIASAGATTTAAGVAMGLPILKAIKDYASFEDAMMGVARQVNGAKDANGKYTQTYYEMGDAIKAMAERMPLATTEIAKIIEAGARMGIQGKENLLTYAQTTAIMATAFELPVDQVGEDVAKIAALYKVPIKGISELGDVINYLDDNALAKGGDIIDVMKRIAGTADTVGMKYKDAAALASTFLSLGANSEVAASASNAIMTNLSVATMQSGRFQKGLEMLKLSARGVQLGMTKDSTGTILKVLDAIKSLPQEKQLEATTRLFGKEFGDDAAKLASNLAEYRKQLVLVNDAKSKGSMQREAESRNQALSAQFIMMKNTVFDLSSELGQSLKPALVDIMSTVADVLRGVRDWVKAHPELAAHLVKVAALIAGVVTVVGALGLGLAAALGPIALLKLSLATLSIGGAAGGLTALLGKIGMLTAAFTLGYEAGNLLNMALEKYIFNGKATLGTKLYDWLHPENEKTGKPAGQLLYEQQISAAKKNMAALGLGVAMTGAANAQPVTIDNRPPITAPAAYAANRAPTQTNHFAIHAAPGMNEKQLAQQVALELEKHNRQQAARSRSKLTDSE